MEEGTMVEHIFFWKFFRKKVGRDKLEERGEKCAKEI